MLCSLDEVTLVLSEEELEGKRWKGWKEARGG